MRFLAFLYSFLFVFALSADEPALMILRGHLSREEVQKREEQLASLKAPLLIIEINSTSGELVPALDLAKKLYELKIEKGLQTVVYIEDNAVGPAAILPFLADKLYISLSVSWGDIPLGTAQALSTNILRNRVVSFISPANPQAALLSLLAAGMSDPSVQIVDDKGWKIASDEKDRSLPSLSSPGAPLVVNQNQLQQLKLVSGVMPLEKFEAQFALTQVQQKAPPSNLSPDSV